MSGIWQKTLRWYDLQRFLGWTMLLSYSVPHRQVPVCRVDGQARDDSQEPQLLWGYLPFTNNMPFQIVNLTCTERGQHQRNHDCTWISLSANRNNHILIRHIAEWMWVMTSFCAWWTERVYLPVLWERVSCTELYLMLWKTSAPY